MADSNVELLLRLDEPTARELLVWLEWVPSARVALRASAAKEPGVAALAAGALSLAPPDVFDVRLGRVAARLRGMLGEPRLAVERTRQSCSWCDTLVELSPDGAPVFCPNCGHRGDLPRMGCTCGRPGCRGARP